MKIEPGVYSGTVTAASIKESTSGAVMCQFRVDVNGVNLPAGICLVQKDGTLSERGFRDVKSIFGWADWDWTKWEADPESFAGASVQAVVEEGSFTNDQGEEISVSRIKYLNPPGGGSAQLAKADARSLAAKYGAKTRALFGGAAPMRPPTLGPKIPVVPPRPPPPPPPAPKAPECKPATMEACWEAFTKMNEGRAEHELYAGWTALLDEMHPGKGQNDLTPSDWGRVFETLSPTFP